MTENYTVDGQMSIFDLDIPFTKTSPATLGSLFDGISGFPYCHVRCNGTGSVLWSSEIEEFPMAVAKQHFGDEETGQEGDIREFL